MGEPVRRWTISALIEVDIYGDDELEAFEHFADAIDEAACSGHVRDIIVKHSDTKAVPFVVPTGAERWAKAATEIRYSDEQHRAAMHDGSWWWTDGHSALRCEGEPPDGFRRVEDPFKGGSELPTAPRPTTWGPALKSTDGHGVTAHRADTDQDVAIQTKYLKLVADSVPGVTWKIGSTTKPVMAFLGDKCIALVMPFRADRLVSPAASKEEAHQ